MTNSCLHKTQIPLGLLVEGAYFVGRKEVLAWINSTCDLNVPKVEDTASGAVACLLLDIMYPGQVPLQRVNWSANKSFEYVSNYKILQNAFTKLRIDRHIDVDRLISGRAMDNLEFMQWFKRYFELQVGERPASYDPVAARLRGKGGNTYKGAVGAAGGAAPAAATTGSKQPTRSTTAPSDKEGRKTSARSGRVDKEANNTKPTSAPSAASGATLVEMQERRKENNDMKLDMHGLEKERDFYFTKLRDIEIMLQDIEEAGNGQPASLTKDIFQILYATADGFVQSPSAASVASAHLSPTPNKNNGASASLSASKSPSRVDNIIQSGGGPAIDIIENAGLVGSTLGGAGSPLRHRITPGQAANGINNPGHSPAGSPTRSPAKSFKPEWNGSMDTFPLSDAVVAAGLADDEEGDSDEEMVSPGKVQNPFKLEA